MTYETVIGLEVHCELSTKTKIFCGCSTKFGAAPNTQVCAGCAGFPGALPVLNRAVVDYAVRAGLALHCGITRVNSFDRKHYFYPDLPAAYQTTQLYAPVCTNGYVELASGKRARIKQIHMEEDAGKLVHDEWEDVSLADYNRGSMPLLEIVGEPDLRCAEEVIDYLERLKAILEYTQVSDCKMQEGSLRADINISVRPMGSETLGVRTEMKNINSMRAIARAIAFEAARHVDVIEAGGQLVQETRRWDDDAGESFSMRSKENAADYRYFPDPNLPPVVISEEEIERARAALPELPEAKKRRYTEALGLPEYDTGIITGSVHLVRLFERTAALCGDAKEAANWVMGEVLRLLQQTGTLPEDMDFDFDSLAKVIALLQKNVINRGTAKKVFAQVFSENVDPERYVNENNLAMVTDSAAIREEIKRVIAANRKSVEEFRSGKEKALQFLIGQSMRALKGQAPAQEVRRVIEEEIG